MLDLPPETTRRIVFREITKSAIEAAVKSPRTVDMNLVQAQQARQILDRIVGFELSPVVWQKVPGGKSAGRVQSPAVRLLVEREQEITAFEGSSQFRVVALFIHDNQEFKAELNQRFDTEEEATEFEHLKGSSFGGGGHHDQTRNAQPSRAIYHFNLAARGQLKTRLQFQGHHGSRPEALPSR